jgi:murein DD-endopeptidase MepM/ murein hydrolase activator NlpD
MGRTGARALLACCALVAALSGLAGGHAQAQTDSDKQRVDNQIQAVQGQVAEVSAEEGRLYNLLAASSARKAELDAKVATIDGQIRGVQARLDAAESKLGAIQADQRRTEGRLAEATTQLTEAKGELARQAIAAYTGQSEAARYATMLLGSATVGDLASRRSYLKAVVGSQSEAIRAEEKLRDEVKDLRDSLEASRADAEGQRATVDAERATLQGARNEQESVRSQVAVEVAENDKLHDQAQSRKEEFQGELENLEQESSSIAATLRARAAQRSSAAKAPTAAPSAAPSAAGGGDAAEAAPAIPPGNGRMMFPIPGGSIVSGFGPRVHPVYGDVRVHTGVDISASTGTPIHAAADGVVVSAGTMGGYGNATVIEHAGNLATLYGHQSAIGVSEGETVKQGQVIGRVGCTGTCTGPHLHWEVRLDGTPVNPMNYV